MSFQGSLRELHLPDVIQLVSVSGKSGCFKLVRGSETGLIYLEGGRIAHAVVAKLTGEEAVYALATWDDGTFRFIPDEAAPTHTITKSNTNLLMEAARRMDEWRVLSKRIPSLDRIPKFQVPEGKQGQINLNTQEWLILSKIDGKSTIEEIAERINLSTFEVAKLLYGLVTMGLIVLVEPALEPAGAAATDEGLAPLSPIPSTIDVQKELLALIQKLRQEAQASLGQTGWPVVLRAYRRAKEDLEAGKGTQAIQDMCAEILTKAVDLGGPETQRQLAEHFRDILASWNATLP